jgi:hypothetical protein
MPWITPWYPYHDAISVAQDRTERMYEREDAELRWQITAERFEHKEQTNGQGQTDRPGTANEGK